MFGLFTRKQKAPESERTPITFYNTLTADYELFTPLRSEEARMYNCGPTVYDYAQIGNLRSYVFADTLKRVLRHNGYGVRQVINITDVGHLSGENAGDADSGEDKMSKAIRAAGLEMTRENMRAVGEQFTEAFIADLGMLGIDTSRITFPRASDHIPGQIALIQALDEKGYTYTTSDGVYFDTSCFPEYGKLGGIDTGALKAGARVAENTEKRHPTDFALWKRNAALGWESPWGRGFPGWHIECSAMIYALLGKHIDIHTGGIDHIPTHHNNEIAQSESVFGSPFVRYWMHNAFVSVEGKKISKSLGNTITLRNICDAGYSPRAYRYWLLSAHYRTPINFTWDALDASQTALTRLHRHFVEQLGTVTGTPDSEYIHLLTKAVNADLDTPKAIALLWDLEKDTELPADTKRATFLAFDAVLGLGFRDTHTRLYQETQKLAVDDLPAAVKKKIEERTEARAARDFETADALRAEIRKHGFDIEDTDAGPVVTRH